MVGPRLASLAFCASRRGRGGLPARVTLGAGAESTMQLPIHSWAETTKSLRTSNAIFRRQFFVCLELLDT